MIDLRAVPRPGTATHIDVRALTAGAHLVETVLSADRAVLGEHPVWHAAQQQLLWVDVVGRWVHGWAPEPRSQWSLTTASEVSLAWPAHGGGIVLATAAGMVVLGTESDECDGTAVYSPLGPSARPSDMPSTFRFNDGACDARGNLWISSMGAHPLRDSGVLYRVRGEANSDGTGVDAASLTFHGAISGLGCGNGVGWSPDGSTCYVVESVTRTVLRLAVNPLTGSLSDPEPFLTFVDGGPLPDGLVVDRSGAVWVAMWEGSCVLRFSPDGVPLGAWVFPVPRVTCPGFGAPGTTEMFVTSARPESGFAVGDPARPSDGARTAATDMRHDGEEAGHQLAGAVFRFDAGVSGLPVTPFAGQDTA